MAKCLDCGQIYCTYGGSEGSSCPICKSKNIDVSTEVQRFKIKKEE